MTVATFHEPSLVAPLKTSGEFFGDPENLETARHWVGRDRFDWCSCPHGCNWRRCAGDEPDCVFIRHHFPSDAPLEGPLAVNPKDWPTGPAVVMQQVPTAAATPALTIGIRCARR